MTTLRSSLEDEFVKLHENSATLLRLVSSEELYLQPPRNVSDSFPARSCGEHLLRSAATVEQTFGGLTANLWDDPFEWTLPETLPNAQHIITYLDEVAATRRRGFALLGDDDDLAKEIIVPTAQMTGARRTLFALIAETLVRAAHHQGRAYAIFKLFSARRLPHI